MFSLAGYSTRLSKRLKTVEDSRRVANELKVLSDTAIALLHAGKFKQAARKIKMAELAARALKKQTERSFIVPFQEYAECRILLEVMVNGKIPTRVQHVADAAYVLGLADVVGEFNRAFLHALIRKDMPAADKYLNAAVKVHDALRSVNFPDSIVPSLRRKKDACRIILNNMLAARARQGV